MKSLSKILVAVFALFLAVSSCNVQEVNVEFSKYMNDGTEAIQNNDYETAFNNFSKELEENPNNIQALCLQSQCYMNHFGDLKEALRCSNKAVKLAKKKKNIDDYSKSAAYAGRGDVYYNLGELDKAIKDYTIAIDIYPEEFQNYIYRAVCYKNQENYDLFEADCKKIITLDPENIRAYMYLGDVAIRNEDYDKAIEYYSEAIKVDNAFSSAYAYRGVCYFALGNEKQAASDIVEALDIDSNNEAFDFMLKMSALNFDVIFDEFNSRYEEEPQNPSWPYYIGLIYENATQFKQALKYYEKVYEIAPEPMLLEIIEEVKSAIGN
jgi:tetratricopeptide (TPR) repeat protein